MFFACSNSLRFFFTRVRLLTIFVLTERVYFFVCSFAPKFVSNVAFDARFVCAREFPAHRRYGGVTLAKGKPDVGRYALLGRLRTHFSQNSVRNRDRFSYTGMLNLISPKIAEKFFFSRSLTLPKVGDHFVPFENKNKFCYLNSPTW